MAASSPTSTFCEMKRTEPSQNTDWAPPVWNEYRPPLPDFPAKSDEELLQFTMHCGTPLEPVESQAAPLLAVPENAMLQLRTSAQLPPPICSVIANSPVGPRSVVKQLGELQPL